MLTYYISGIKKISDYKSTANRKDLNLYILNYILLSIGINLFFTIMYLIVGLNDFFINLNIKDISVLKLQHIVLFWFSIISQFAHLTLIKRRLNDLIPNKALICFLFIVIGWIIPFIWLPIMKGIAILSIEYSLPRFVDKTVAYSMLAYLIVVIVAQITLMVKK